MATEKSRQAKRKFGPSTRSPDATRRVHLRALPDDYLHLRGLLLVAAGLLCAADTLLAKIGDAAVTTEFSAAANVPRRPDSMFRAGGPLTIREREVAALVGQGQTNRRIAQTLFISERTAENHVQNILNKLGYDTRVQIAAWAIRNGLTPSDGQVLDPILIGKI